MLLRVGWEMIPRVVAKAMIWFLVIRAMIPLLATRATIWS
jgi:hypothetical protein